MSLSLLVPLSLVLGTLVVGPILAHLARQKPVERIPFGAMILLRRLVKRVRRQRRIRDPFLLLLRLFAVLALVLAATQPRLVWQGDVPETGLSGRVVFVIDNSLSMAQIDEGQTLFSKAREAALERMEQLPIGAQIAVVSMGGTAEAFGDRLHTQVDRARANLEGIQQSHGGTDLVGALHAARILLEGEPGEVLVFTDEAGPGVVEEASLELELLLGIGASVIPVPLQSDRPQNIAVTHAEYGEGLEGGSILVRVQNFGATASEVLLTVGLPDDSEISAFVDVAPFESAEERITVPPEVPGGVAWARVADPSLALDDTRYFHLPRVGASRVLVVDGDPGATAVASEVYFLERALAPWGGGRGGVLPEIKALSGLAELDPERHRVVILANVADPGPYAASLVDFVRQGGGLVISGGENVTKESYNGPLRDLLPAPLRKRRNLVDLSARGGVPLALPSTESPLFRAFSRGGRLALTRITARRVLTFEAFQQSADLRVLAEWEGGIPALIEREVGRGRVLVWTSTFDLGWGNAPIQSAFMPLIQRMISVLGGGAAGNSERMEVEVGSQAQLVLPEGLWGSGTEPVMMGPSGSPVAFQVEGTQRPILRFFPKLPGAYALQIEGAPPMAWIAANSPLKESDVRVSDRLAAIEAEMAPELFLRELRLARGLLWASLMFFVLQGAWGGWLMRRRNEPA